MSPMSGVFAVKPILRKAKKRNALKTNKFRPNDWLDTLMMTGTKTINVAKTFLMSQLVPKVWAAPNLPIIRLPINIKGMVKYRKEAIKPMKKSSAPIFMAYRMRMVSERQQYEIVFILTKNIKRFLPIFWSSGLSFMLSMFGSNRSVSFWQKLFISSE